MSLLHLSYTIRCVQYMIKSKMTFKPKFNLFEAYIKKFIVTFSIWLILFELTTSSDPIINDTDDDYNNDMKNNSEKASETMNVDWYLFIKHKGITKYIFFISAIFADILWHKNAT